MVDREMLVAMEELLDRKLDEKLNQKFSENLKPINDRLDRLETSVQKLDERTSGLEAGIEELGKQVSKLDDQMGKLDGRVAQLEVDMTYVKVVQLENNVIRRLNTIEKFYIDTSTRYMERTEQIDRMNSDISILKCVVTKHSELLRKAQ